MISTRRRFWHRVVRRYHYRHLVGVGMGLIIHTISRSDSPKSARCLLTGAMAGYFLSPAGISLTTFVSGPPHPSFRRGTVVCVGLAILICLLGFANLTDPFMLLGLIVSDTLGPEPPTRFERGKERKNTD